MIKLLLSFNFGDEFKLSPNVAINQASGYKTLGEFFSRLIPNIFIIASLILFVFLIAGGGMLVFGANNPEEMKKGSKVVSAALIGFALIFASFWIIKIIEHLTGLRILNPQID